MPRGASAATGGFLGFALGVGCPVWAGTTLTSLFGSLLVLLCGAPLISRIGDPTWLPSIKPLGWLALWIALAASFVPFLALTAEGRLTRAHGIAMLVGLVLFLIRGYVNGRRNGHQPTGQELLESEPVVAPHARIGVPVALLLIAIGLAALVLGGGMLVDAAVEVARGFGVSELVIGLTVVAAGTSAPELVTSIVAAARGHSDIAVGNVLGSNVFNILCILGITCVVTPQAVSSQLLRSDVPAMIVSTVLMLPMVRFGRVPRIGGAVLLVGYVGYVTWRVLGGSAT